MFGVRSVNLTPWSSTRKVYEVLEPGCISRELLMRSDVVLNLNHSNMVPDVLGRYRNSEKDTLTLEMRGDGIDCRCDLPRTNNANDALELIKRGDINGMSFAFEDDYEDTENGVSYERTNDIEDGKEVWIRHVKKITGLYDVAIVTHPAYEQTSVGMREASDRIDAAIDAQIKREVDEEQKRACGGGDDDNRGCGGGDDDEAKRKAEEEEAAKREQEEREQRELEYQEQRFRECRALRMRMQARRLNDEILESLSY